MHFQEVVSRIVCLDRVSDQKKITAIKSLFLADNDSSKIVLEIEAENDDRSVAINIRPSVRHFDQPRDWNW